MKRVVDLGRLAHRDRIGQQAIEPAADPVQRNRALGAEARDLAARVNPGVGARRPGDRHLVIEQLRERLFEVLLHGGAVRLSLPAAQGRSVVLDDQSDVPHPDVLL